MITKRIHSNGMIFAPGFWRFITDGLLPSCSANDRKIGRKLLKEFQFTPSEIRAVVKKAYTTSVEGETLIVTFK